MSEITGLDAVKEKYEAYGKALKVRLDEAVEKAAREFQRDLVTMAPVHSGRLREALSGDDAIRIKKGRDGVEISVGFLTGPQKKKAFHAFFIEFGTKGYTAGQRRFAGKTKSGRTRFSKIKRTIPARPAHPFFRPAYLNLVRNLNRYRAEAHALALVDMATGGIG